MRRHKGDLMILALTVILMMVGLVVIYAVGPLRINFLNALNGTNQNPNHFFIRQLISVMISLAVMAIAYKMPEGWLRKGAKWVLMAGFAACLLLMGLAMMKSGLARCELGACRWYNLGPMGFQPAELLKLGVLLYMADLIAKRKAEGKLDVLADFWMPILVVLGLSMFIIVVVQKDLGTGVTLAAIVLAMVFVSGVKLARFAAMVAAMLLLGAGLILSSPHRVERLKAFSGGDASKTYHIDNAMIAIGTGGLFGVGIGNSVQATGYLPESINDSVFAVMGETFGLMGLVAVLGMFFGLVMRMLSVMERVRDENKKLLMAGVAAWLMAHVVVNVAAMTGLMPLTGITLPFLSYGGTSMMFVTLIVGIALAISCYTEREERR